MTAAGDPVRPLLSPDDTARLRDALLAAEFTVDGLTAALGPGGEAALARGDLAGMRRALPDGAPVSVLARLFLLGEAFDAATLATALGPLPVDAAVGAGLLVRSGSAGGSAGASAGGDAGDLLAGFDLRPHGADLTDAPWWIVSDLGADVRPGPLDPEHVLGVGLAAVSLAGVTVRRPVRRALDVGTGSGVQALHLSTHADAVTATDVSARALSLAATSWALSVPDRAVDLRRGSWLDPVAGETFDQVVANPPFVISPAGHGSPAGGGRFTYRDGGAVGDDVCRRLVGGIGTLLRPGGFGQLLANWLVTADDDGDWPARVGSWVHGCDAWVWQRELADLGEYAALWLRDAGDGPHLPGYAERYDAWVDGLRDLGAVAIGMGSVHLRRLPGADRAEGDGRGGSGVGGDREVPVIVAEDVRQPLEPPLGEAVAGWFERAAWLAGPGADPRRLLASALRPAPDVELIRIARPAAEHPGTGWVDTAVSLRQTSGLRWEIEADDVTATVVGALDGTRPVGLLLDLLTATRTDLGPPDALLARAVPVLRDLVARGLLLPPGAHR